MLGGLCDQSAAYFTGLGEHYKAEIIASIPSNEDVSLYREGAFEDLCRGPHVPSTGKLKHFKLMKVAGAYWRGDHRNEMLQRVYGTAWASKEDLKAYLPTVLDRDDAEATRRCEHLIRTYDPCISCATHFLTLSVDRAGGGRQEETA